MSHPNKTRREPLTTCNLCGDPIYWRRDIYPKTGGRRPMPVSFDATTHKPHKKDCDGRLIRPKQEVESFDPFVIAPFAPVVVP